MSSGDVELASAAPALSQSRIIVFPPKRISLALKRCLLSLTGLRTPQRASHPIEVVRRDANPRQTTLTRLAIQTSNNIARRTETVPLTLHLYGEDYYRVHAVGDGP
jgi:hypothetical protein